MKTSRVWELLTSGVKAGMVLTLIQLTLAAPQQEKQVVSQNESAKYAGSDTCKTCHEDLYKNQFEHTPPFKTTLQDGTGCKSCHDPGSAHVEGGGDVSTIISFRPLPRQTGHGALSNLSLAKNTNNATSQPLHMPAATLVAWTATPRTTRKNLSTCCQELSPISATDVIRPPRQTSPSPSTTGLRKASSSAAIARSSWGVSDPSLMREEV